MSKNATDQELLDFSIITTPRVSMDECISFAKGQIVFTPQGEITLRAFDEEHVVQLIDILGCVMRDFDPLFRSWVLQQVEESRQYHPSDPGWAYQQIPLATIPLLKLSESAKRRVKAELESYELPDFWPTDPESVEVNRIFWP